MHFADGCQVNIILLLEIVDVLSADQAVSDEPNLDPVVRAQHARVERGGHARAQKSATSHGHRRHNIPLT